MEKSAESQRSEVRTLQRAFQRPLRPKSLDSALTAGAIRVHEQQPIKHKVGVTAEYRNITTFTTCLGKKSQQSQPFTSSNAAIGRLDDNDDSNRSQQLVDSTIHSPPPRKWLGEF
ncbi:hypothetical protein TrVFT333_009093 [Trichoderma virens FT-333]|nr:hypothetical protein TrVFT333_009093 [Trichoderma virens FT-333]